MGYGGLDFSTDFKKMPSPRSKEQESSTKDQESTLVAEDEGEVAVSETKPTKKKKKKKKKKKEEVDSEKDFEDFCNKQELPPPQRSPQHPPQEKRYNSFSACLNAPERGADGMTNRERMRELIESRGHIMM